MNKLIHTHYSKPTVVFFLLPLALLLKIALVLYSLDCLSVHGYIFIQKDWFYFINHYVQQAPETLANLTQFGDALILLSFLTLFILYTPKLWEALLTSSLISFIFAVLAKEIFAIPRPAKAFDYTTFNIIGEKLSGSTSFPSGHAITVFTVLTVLLFALSPQNKKYKIPYFIVMIVLGLLFAFTRVAVGAHYPLDVLVGCIVGYTSGVLGTYISQHYALWPWIYHKKYYPVFLGIFLICCIILLFRIQSENLFIYYCALLSLLFSLYKMTQRYVQK
ncbi:phosphatase PAP2 family protein [Myroides odoratus]|uniref:phosphatase PAP2 family protein n=1 Tax=Myroides odoratus TaxID=256 RepID=UPI0033418D0F